MEVDMKEVIKELHIKADGDMLAYKELLAGAYCKFTNLSPDECEVVNSTRINPVTKAIENISYFRKKGSFD